VFIIRLNLGNAAMRTPGDVANALRRTADSLDRMDRYTMGRQTDGLIKDINGNTVGSWGVRAWPDEEDM
jgi:hypothetical protein